jgi:hypothetical protein
MTTGDVRRCSAAVHRENVDAARAVLARHACVAEGSVRYDGERLCFDLELSSLPPGDGPAVELVLRREVEGAR